MRKDLRSKGNGRWNSAGVDVDTTGGWIKFESEQKNKRKRKPRQ